MRPTSPFVLTASSVVLACVSFGCAGTRLADAQTAPYRRGEVHVAGPGDRAVVAGPVTIHAYSGFKGGEVYTVPVASGGDADCGAERAMSGSRVRLEAENIRQIEIPAGSMACLAGDQGRSLELLWHAVDGTPGGARQGVVVARQP